MTSRFRSRLRGASTLTAIAAALALAGCNPSGSVDRSQSAQLPALPATLPLAPGDVTAPAYAPAAALLPAARPIRTVRVADPRDSYAYADDAWGFADALGDAPPDYGFYYGDAQPWAWQGYDDSIAFVEPLDDGYRYYYYRPGADTPYFVRDPDYGYGYDNGQLAVVYGAGGALVPYADYGPRLDYASRYYARGRDLYRASRQRRPVIAANWAARRDAIVDTQRWAAARASQRAWQDYHQRTEAGQAQHWGEEQARRRADTVRFAAWQGQDFRTPPPPRAIPVAWTRANWAQDQRRFAPPATGFNGDAAARERAATQERERVARDARPQNPAAFVAGPGLQRQQPQPQDQQRADFARQQAERAQQARALGDQRLAAQQRQQQDAARQLQAQANQQAAARDAQARARQQADRAAGEQARQRQAQANDRAQAQQHAQADMQQKRQEQARRGQEQQRQATQAQQRAQGRARAQEQVVRAQQRQAAETQQRAQSQAQAQQRQAAQAQQRAQGQARAQEQAAQAQQRQAAQAQQRAQSQAQAQQRQAAQAQQRAEVQARQRPASPPPQARPAQPAAPAARGNPGNGGGHKHEPH